MADRLATPEASVGDLFMGAFFPGFLLGGTLHRLRARCVACDPAARPPALRRAMPPISPRVIRDTIVAVVPTAFLILAVLGSIFFGIATPTEASGVGAFGAMLLAALQPPAEPGDGQARRVRQTTRTSAFIFAIFVGATAFTGGAARVSAATR
ncbi:MAG: TRAP transporter large permease subunit [Halofilum sp. (in: g-proteobacteria)]|nr:TRAP transporter large permease subunit [Halofilum sp. (in: g-proteobacteria)]